MMATFTDPHAFAAHIAGYGQKIQAAEKPAVSAAAKVAGAAIKAEGSRFRIRDGKQLGVNISADSVTATGPWGLIEQGAKPHRINPRRRRAVVVPGRGVFAHVQHPGTGSIGHPWEQGVAIAQRTAPLAFEAEIVKVFG